MHVELIKLPYSAPRPTATYSMRFMASLQYTDYFERVVLRRRPYLKKAWCEAVVAAPTRIEPQESNRHRFWAPIPELRGRYLRVITLEDKVTVHNAFPDRGFRP